ncbi:MAG: DNA polymerase III subunit [Planctomycetota bacterium]|jgi:DNA polymerase-3 subunit delta'
MSLKQIFCQDNAISVLQRALAAEKLAHAYIFTGPEGVGKFKTARQYTKLLLCEKPIIESRTDPADTPNFADSCDSCQSCRLFEASSHPDFNLIYKELIQFTKEGKGRTSPVDLPIDVIREFLINRASTRPTLSERKVFLVTEAEKLNHSSQNSLLKVLEEPPEYCCIILLCTRLDKLLPTIKSRCQIIRFSLVDEERIIEKLKELGLSSEKARYFSRLARGSLGQACQWAQLELADADLYKTKKKLLTALATRKYQDALDLAQWLLDQAKEITAIWTKLDETTSKTDVNRRTAKTLVQIIISALHDAMKINLANEEQLINFDQLEQVKKLAAHFNPTQSAEKIADCFKTMRWIDASVNQKLIFEQLLLNLTNSDKMKVY